MAAPYSNIETKCELAFQRHLNTIASRIAGVTIHAGVESADLPLPCVVVATQSADEHIKFSGQYSVDVEIIIMSNADDTAPALHRQRVAYVRDELSVDWIGASLNTYVTDFTVAGAVSTWGVILENASQSVDDRHWITTIPLTVHCRPS